MTTGFLISLLALIAVSVAVYRIFTFLREDLDTRTITQDPAPETGSVPTVSLNGIY